MKTRGPRNAFSLVEVTLALGVAGFCLLVIIGILPTGVNINRTSFAQTSAANLSTSIAADLEATASTSSVTPVYALSMSGTNTLYLTADGSTVSSAVGAQYRATVTTAAPTTTASGGTNAATVARILITWPAAAAQATGGAGSVDTVIGLNRN